MEKAESLRSILKFTGKRRYRQNEGGNNEKKEEINGKRDGKYLYYGFNDSGSPFPPALKQKCIFNLKDNYLK